MKSFLILFVFFAFQINFSQTITLRDTTNQYDYIIITVPEFVSVCEQFKEHKETVRGFNTLIVETAQIYSEFDSSSTPQDNIRDFISYAGTFWENPQPKYFLIAGSVQFVPNFNIMHPIYSSPYWQSDFYYSRSVYDDDSTTTEYYIGRIPAKNSVELDNYFNKVIYYENNNVLQSWMNNALFICEDDIQFGFLDAAISISENFLPDFIRSYFIVNDTNSIYFGNKDSIYNAINNRGCSTIWFEGHSSDSSFAYSDLFNLADINGLVNQNKYFISVFVSTQRAIIDSNTNLTNEMLVLQNAGSLGGIVSVGLSYWGVGKAFHNKWAQRLYDPAIQSIGESFTLDNLVPQSGIYWQMILIANLWCDPSLKLKYDITVDVEDRQVSQPQGFALYQNYPNPFNPSTKIKFSVPYVTLRQAQGDIHVTLKVYDLLGNELTTLVNEEKPAGNYEVEFSAIGGSASGGNAYTLPSGVYFYQLKAGPFFETKKMVLLR
jgi:hypothetical protein